MTGSFERPAAAEFDHAMRLILTRKQTNEVKASLKQYKILPKTSPFDYLDLYDRKFYTLNFRVVRFAISEDSYECIITNLPKEEFPADEVKKIYAMRWGLKHLSVNDERAWFKTHPQWSKSNRYAELKAWIFT